eukprot:TRINITY_DN11284_c0_g1_i1.p1 TRINITY_DN11284_c0_g1~~TRINITY_DN11284_c0_g1_i1.p1  ORF type:complete len:313 (-),score=29.65 TRINITY_DN11284_c0_g1_i1:22-960(-)
MSIILSNCQQISSSPVNTSASKQLFSFSKAPRFNYTNNVYCNQPFYQLPETKDNRKTTLGIGPRNTLMLKNISPSPGTYPLPSDFTKDKKKGFQFGIGRDAYSKVFYKESPPQSTTAPGPGTYASTNSALKSSPKFSMRTRTAEFGIAASSKGIPGPGQYQLPTSIDPKGRYQFAKYRNSAATLFNPPSSVRFKDTKGFVPGPGQYSTPSAISKEGTYAISNFRSSGSIRFLQGSRAAISSSSSLLSPGPGSYRLPSEFGYYGSKFAQTLDERQWKTAGGAEKPRTVSKPVNINKKSGTADPSVKAAIQITN